MINHEYGATRPNAISLGRGSRAFSFFRHSRPSAIPAHPSFPPFRHSCPPVIPAHPSSPPTRHPRPPVIPAHPSSPPTRHPRPPVIPAHPSSPPTRRPRPPVILAFRHPCLPPFPPSVTPARPSFPPTRHSRESGNPLPLRHSHRACPRPPSGSWNPRPSVQFQPSVIPALRHSCPSRLPSFPPTRHSRESGNPLPLRGSDGNHAIQPRK